MQNVAYISKEEADAQALKGHQKSNPGIHIVSVKNVPVDENNNELPNFHGWKVIMEVSV